MSVNITIKDAVKKYGDKTIIKNLNLKINKGEFFTLLGPSGCGKTTLLRMIAGFNTIEGGDFLFNDTRVNDLNPAKRNTGMVFQNYAIFPNMTVRKNVEYGLKARHLDPKTIREEAAKFLNLMQIAEYADRMPERLSGGQQQRVALARALVIKPDVLLMDEPLSNLDAKLRVEMRAVIKNIQHTIGITTVYVTHDQEEAMAISDRIGVMKDGVIHQIGVPKDIYQRPLDLIVASFIGKSNLLDAKLQSGGDILFDDTYKVSMENAGKEAFGERDVVVCVRPEDFVINKTGSRGLKGIIQDSVFLGLNTHYFVNLDCGQSVEIIQESTTDEILPVGSSVVLTVKPSKINVFDKETEKNIFMCIKKGKEEAGI